MVLFKRKAIHFAPPIYVEEDDPVWWIDATGEYFTEYDDFLKRMDFYSQRKFICEVTGHSCLTLFEALKSELKGSTEIMDAFPENLKEPVLRRIQFSTISRLDGLVDTLYGEFKKDFFPGEVVIAIIDTSSGATERIPAVIREKAKFNSITLDSGEVRPATTKYRLEALSDASRVYVCDESQLTRDRKHFTKVTLKTFVKYSSKKENWNGAPWLVRPEYADKYRIDQTVPVHLTQYRGNPSPEELRKQRNNDRLKAKQARDTEKTDLLQQRQKQRIDSKEKNAADALIRTLGGLSGLKEKDIRIPASPGNFGTSAASGFSGTLATLAAAAATMEKKTPPPKQVIKEDLEFDDLVGRVKKPQYHFDTIYPAQATDVALEVWVFINVYKEVFVLDSFTFDDFIDALRFDGSTGDCELLNEIHCSLLSQIVGSDSDQILIEYPKGGDSDEEEDEEEEEEAEGDEEQGKKAIKVEEVKVEEVQEENGRGRRRSTRSQNGNGVKKEVEKVEVEVEEVEKEEEVEEVEAVVEKSTGDNKGSSFAVFKGQDWKTRLQRRTFKDGGWQVILIGLLYNLTYYEPLEDFINGCLDVLAPIKGAVTMNAARDRYFQLDFTQKVTILQILCNLIHGTDAIRAYIDECMTRVADLRRDKVDKQREYKSVADDTRVIELEVRKIELEEELREEQKEQKEKENGEEKEVAEPPSKKAKTDSDHLLATLKTKLSDKQKESEDIVATIRAKDEEIRFADINRLRLLGKDRFHNRYWWFEGNGIEDASASSEEGTGFTMGRLWVQGPFEDEVNCYLAGSIIDSKRQVEGEGFLQNYKQWAFLEHPKELGELIQWFNQWGVRENKLKKELLAVLKKMKASMVSRLEDLDRESELNEDKGDVDMEEGEEGEKGGEGEKKEVKEGEEGEAQEEKEGEEGEEGDEENSEFDRVCAWSNGYAVSKLGHSHYEGPSKKTAKKDTKKKRK